MYYDIYLIILVNISSIILPEIPAATRGAFFSINKTIVVAPNQTSPTLLVIDETNLGEARRQRGTQRGDAGDLGSAPRRPSRFGAWAYPRPTAYPCGPAH
jgi:hypothetical protein